MLGSTAEHVGGPAFVGVGFEFHGENLVLALWRVVGSHETRINDESALAATSLKLLLHGGTCVGVSGLIERCVPTP
jgi:hypothetical protein